ncbi:MAG TPA: hypothetical protein VFK89_11300 [Actinomycetota bacterium]|nr:hypothetical protein [Actinomycetota bacterium]
MAIATEETTVEQSATSYRTFSGKVPTTLLAGGGALAAIGALGEWVRATKVASESMPPQQVATVMGYSEAAGPLIAIVAALAAVLAFAWSRRSSVGFVHPSALRVASSFATIILVALIGWRVPEMDRQAAAMAHDAQTGALDFVAFHAGLGWGAWCLVIAAALTVAGFAAGLLREVDRKRGIPE